MNGKSKCKILKDIRRQIAKENDIHFITSECKFQGDCTGTCPKCEAEVRYLEQELRKRQLAGKAVAVAGIAAAMVVASAGCAVSQDGGDPLPGTEPTHYSQSQNSSTIPGMIITPPETTALPDHVLMGDLVSPGAMIPDSTEDLVDGELIPDPTDEPVYGELVPDSTEDLVEGELLPPDTDSMPE